MKRYLKNRINTLIQLLFSRLLGRFNLFASIQEIRFLGFKKLSLNNITFAIASNEQNPIAQIESVVCNISLWQSLTGRWLAGESVMSNLRINWPIIAEKEFRLSSITLTFGINSKKGTIHIETCGTTLTAQLSRKKERIEILFELNTSWNSYLSILNNHLNFNFLKNAHSSTPILLYAIFTYTPQSNQSVFFNASIMADDFALTPAVGCEAAAMVIDKPFLLNTLFSKHGGDYFTSDTYVPYEAVPEHVINAILCTEDPHFWTHRGIAPAFIGYALEANIKSGCFERGASTITMQLVRNLFLNHHKNILRKVEECAIALLLENYFTINKKDILELYLNLIEFAPNVHGLHNACLFYFNKPYQELTLSDSLALTYIIPRPKHFYEALFIKSEQLKNNLHQHIQQYANVMMRKRFITIDEYNHIGHIIAFSFPFEALTLSPFEKYTNIGQKIRINLLHSQARPVFEYFLSSLEENGFDYLILETIRTQEVQDAYWAQGRASLKKINRLRKAAGLHLLEKEEGKRIITKSKHSIHQDGFAADIVPVLKNGKIPWTLFDENAELWLSFGRLGMEAGLEWGGTWEPLNQYGIGWDAAHYQLSKQEPK